MESNVENPFDAVVKLMEKVEGVLGDDRLEELVSTAIFETVKVDIQQRKSVDPSDTTSNERAGEVCVTFRFSRETFAEHLERALNEALDTARKSITDQESCAGIEHHF